MVTVDYKLGLTSAALVLTYDQKQVISYAILRYGDFYYNPVNEPETDLKDKIKGFCTATDNPTTVCTLQNVYEPTAGSGEYSTGKNSTPLTLEQKALFGIEPAYQIRIPWTNYETALDYTLLLVHKDGCSYQRLDFTIQPEFFGGEYELFAPITGYTYKRKALAFLNTFFQEDDTTFKTFVHDHVDNTISTTAGLWKIFDGKDLTVQKTNFKYTLANHLGMATYKLNDNCSLPYLNIDRYDFDTLYGAGRNAYITTYIHFLFNRGKPLFSSFFQAALNRQNAYDYREYKQLTLQEGNNLAARALEYLTWGVEYTPYSYNSTTTKQGFAGNPVFEKYFTTISGWANGDPATRLQLTRIPILDTTGSGTPKRMQVLEGSYYTDKLGLITQTRDAALSMQASRIDLWTSTNTAWQPGTIAQCIAEAKHPTKPAENDGQITGNTASLYDKKLYHGSSNNLNLTRSSADVLLRAGYKFSTAQKVKAICIVRGRAANANPTCKSGYIQIGYKELVPNYSTFPPAMQLSGETTLAYSKNKPNFTEYVSIPWNREAERKKGQFRIYNSSSEKEPGYGIYSPEYAYDGNLVYNYIILDTTIENCMEITLTDKTGNDYLNITEFMVFPENPLDCIISEKTYVLLAAKNAERYQVLQNYNMNNNYSLAPSGDAVQIYDIQLLKALPVKSVVLWESTLSGGDHGSNSTVYSAPLYVLGGNYGLVGNEYFAHSAGRFDNIITTTNNLGITTPYTTDRGNPLPYAPGGIDNPQLFAYKMYEQWRATEWFKNKTLSVITQNKTTQAKDGQYENYTSEQAVFEETGKKLVVDEATLQYTTQPEYNPPGPDWQNAINLSDKPIKPYLPGYTSVNKDGYVAVPGSPWQPDKVAGVDSVGLLMGALNMAGLTAIYDVLNRPIISNLAAYYNLTEGKPAYYVNDEEQLMNKNYRLTIADLERSTVLVPDIALVQPGDLLVNYNLKDEEMHIGIIVGNIPWENAPRYGENIRNYWDNVLVLSVRRGFQMVNIGRWGNSAGVAGGFTDNPDDYHIRRLLKRTAGDEFNQGRDDPWELVNNVIEKVYCTLKLPQDPYIPNNEDADNPDNQSLANHWIPNTDEGLSGIEILIEIKLTNGVRTPEISDELNNFKILSPRDPFFISYDGVQDKKSNVNTNKGTGIEFWATRETQRYKLATLALRDYDDKHTRDNRYSVTYEPAYFLQDGRGKIGYRLFVKDKHLCFRDDSKVTDLDDPADIQRNRVEISTFEIKAIGTIRPGDDFLVRFGHVSDMGEALFAGATGKFMEDNLDANQGQFVAVYDKKLLWRANLYIDERKTMDGKWKLRDKSEIAGSWEDLTPAQKAELMTIDWNDVHPWVDGNSWAQADAKVPGGQIEIKPWTMLKGAAYFSNGGEVFNAVAYTTGGCDSVADFNVDLEDQATAMGDDAPDDYETLAPGIPDAENPWSNYSADSYRPNYSYKKNKDGEYSRYTAAASAGVDCGGFLMRAASYAVDGNKFYEIGVPDDSKRDIMDAANPGKTSNYPQNMAYPNWWSTDARSFITVSWHVSNINTVVPGDYVLLKKINDDGKESRHVAYVFRVKYADGRNTIKGNIILVEASTWGSQLIIFNKYKYSDYNGYDAYAEKIRRLKPVK